MQTSVALSPPWYTYWYMVSNTLGNDPSVTVSPLQTGSSPYIIPVAVADAKKAQALANIVNPVAVFGNISVAIQVSNGGKVLTPVAPSSSQELGDMVQAALAGNSLLTQVVVQPIFPGGKDVVFPIFTRSVIQFPNDDLSDIYHDYNGVTAAVFKNVLNGSPGGFLIYPSTAK